MLSKLVKRKMIISFRARETFLSKVSTERWIMKMKLLSKNHMDREICFHLTIICKCQAYVFCLQQSYRCLQRIQSQMSSWIQTVLSNWLICRRCRPNVEQCKPYLPATQIELLDWCCLVPSNAVHNKFRQHQAPSTSYWLCCGRLH